MEHSHPDRTYKKSRFQQELEQSVSRKLISSLLLGCLLFCIAIAVVNALNQNARREDHLESVAATFHEVYNNTSAFLLDAGHTELYLQQREDEAEAVRSRTALPPLSEDKVTDPLVLRIVAYLKENYQSKITLADLQEQFHYSERYINQKFQKELGTTVIDYLNRCRIQNALELIRKGKLPISQIGWECGIGEYKYFNHVFKKYIGCSVREYQSTLK